MALGWARSSASRRSTSACTPDRDPAQPVTAEPAGPGRRRRRSVSCCSRIAPFPFSDSSNAQVAEPWINESSSSAEVGGPSGLGSHRRVGRQRRPLLARPRGSAALGVRWGSINACNDVARQQGYSEVRALRRTIYGGDFLADQHPSTRWPAGPRGSSTCSTVWACRSTGRTGLPRPPPLRQVRSSKRTHFEPAHHRPATPVRPTRQTRRYEARQRSPSTSSGSSSTRHRGTTGAWASRAGLLRDGDRSRADAVVMAVRRQAGWFRQSTNSVMCNVSAAAQCFQAGVVRQPGDDPGCTPTAIPSADKLRSCPDPPAASGRSGFPAAKATGPCDIPDAERVLPWKKITPGRQHRAATSRRREIFGITVNQGAGRHGEQVRLSRPDAPRPRLPHPQARRHPGSTRSSSASTAQGAHEDLPGGALHDGRLWTCRVHPPNQRRQSQTHSPRSIRSEHSPGDEQHDRTSTGLYAFGG